MEQSARQHYAAVIIGSGFGGTMTALPLAQEFKRRGQGEKTLILERGTWWTTPVGTVQDKELRPTTSWSARTSRPSFGPRPSTSAASSTSSPAVGATRRTPTGSTT